MLLKTPNFDNAKVVPVNVGLFIGAKLGNVANKSFPFNDIVVADRYCWCG